MGYKENYNKLFKYYKLSYNDLIFIDEKLLNNKKYARLYIHNLSFEQEKDNYIKVFMGYLPFYICSIDVMEYYNLDENIESELRARSKDLWTSCVVPTRSYKNGGIYGELFNDYFCRLIEGSGIYIAYSLKRDFSNGENHGVDNVFLNIKDNKLEIVLSESKFVATLSKAKTELINDIGDIDTDYGHITEKYINDYMYFAVHKNPLQYSDLRSENMNEFISNLNYKMIAERKKFIDAINELQYKVKFIFFAIFQSDHTSAEEIKEYYKDIYNRFKYKIEKTGIKDYSMDVIFVSTKSVPKIIKGAIDDEYRG